MCSTHESLEGYAETFSYSNDDCYETRLKNMSRHLRMYLLISRAKTEVSLTL
jgi:hypothetical protein